MTSANEGGENDETGKLTNNDDGELEALLDSAYEELVKVETTKGVSPPSLQNFKKTSSSNDEKEVDSSEKPKSSENNFDDFLTTMETEFRRLVTAEDPAAFQDIQRLTEELQKAASSSDDPSSAPDFPNLFGPGVNVDALLSGLGFNSTAAEGQAAAAAATANQADPSTSIMGALLSQLLSPDLLYPAVAQLRERYPGWLERNQASPDFERYSRQFEVVKRLCQAYEQQENEANNNNNNQSSAGQNKNMTVIVSLVQELQACGDPPAELLEPGDGDQNQQNQKTTSDNPGDECKVQ